ncbi:hypothetical protein H072_2811 [Dactylellina haptotyla CBS 200.50]|uniref:DUF7357 domain-containing protein n=1 Tax=Dactylellina haptotyla (strain CBS 200.50) TaxID=1284197 RepID=S8AQ38_DACHA|nr:hypothetical protein H072_2811 [Dactylellina haptotyla CBS 200.50]
MRRARLVLNRPGVPQVRIVWPLDTKISQNPRYSVFDLLTGLNDIFPLDSHNHGLEDYVTELGGCELLHFMPIGELIGDNDELTIRLLTNTETKEHLRGGRRQVSTNGRKLQDGVPLGRNYIAPAPDRPRIQGGDRPSKRRKTSQTNTREDSDDELYIDKWGPPVATAPRPRRSIQSLTPKSASSVKSVHFQEDTSDTSRALVLADLDKEDDDEDDDEDFDPSNSEDEDEEGGVDDSESDDNGRVEHDMIFERIGKKDQSPPMSEGGSSPSAGPSDSESDASSDRDSSEESSEDKEDWAKAHVVSKKPALKGNVPDGPDSDSSSESDSDASDDQSFNDSDMPGSSDSSSDSSEEDSSSDESEDEPDELPSKTEPKLAKPPPLLPPITTVPKNPPFQGAASTKSRNQRRRESKALAKLIKNQLLPVGSTKDDLRKWKEEYGNGLDLAPETAQVELETTGTQTNQAEIISEAKNQSPVYVPMEPLELVVEQMEATVDVPATASPQSGIEDQVSKHEEPSSSPAAGQKRRLVASDAARRTILGGLGMRVPRNQAEDQKLREDWKKANSKYVGNKGKGFLDSMVGKEGTHSRFDGSGELATAVRNEPTNEDPDAWKQNIHLSAVECDEDCYDANGDRLPQPTFPFDQQQLWKSQGNLNNPTKSKKKKKKNKRKQVEEEHYEQESWDASYYDDSMQVDSAQRPGPVERSTQGNEEDDLPPVPANLVNYPKLQMPVLPDSIIVFERLGFGANYSPVFQQVTAKVISVEGTNIKFQLAKRDCPEIRYDEETGERIFEKFHMPGMESEENGVEELQFELMNNGRVIKEGVPSVESVEPSAEEDSERVPETVHGDSLEQDNIMDPVSQNNEDIPMLEPEVPVVSQISEESELDNLSGLVYPQSSSFAEPPFQTNGSCGYGHSDTEDDMDGEEDRNYVGPKTTYEDQDESSAEAHRFDDASMEEPLANYEPLTVFSSERGSTPFNTAPEARESAQPEEPAIQVPVTPTSQLPMSPSIDSSRIHNWDLSVDLAALRPEEAGTVMEMIKVKEECPSDNPDFLREALKPFHHPNDTQGGEVDVSVDISPPASPKVKLERLSTQEALESPPETPLKDITKNGTNVVDHNPEFLEDAGDEPEDEGNPNNGSGFSGNDQPPPGSGFSTLQKSDNTLKGQRDQGATYRRQPSIDADEIRRIAIKREDEGGDYDEDFAIPSTMPVRSLTSGRTVFSGRNDAGQNGMARSGITKKPELIIIDSDDDIGSPPPRASLELVGGNSGPSKPGKMKMKPQMIKRRIISKRSESVDPEGSQRRSASSQF